MSNSKPVTLNSLETDLLVLEATKEMPVYHLTSQVTAVSSVSERSVLKDLWSSRLVDVDLSVKSGKQKQTHKLQHYKTIGHELSASICAMEKVEAKLQKCAVVIVRTHFPNGIRVPFILILDFQFLLLQPACLSHSLKRNFCPLQGAQWQEILQKGKF
jgi:hypothetical protein